MILQEIILLGKSFFIKFLFLILCLITLILRVVFISTLNICKCIRIIFNVTIFIVSSLFNIIYGLFTKVLPFSIVFLLQSTLDLFTLFIFLIIKIQIFAIKIQSSFLKKINFLHKGLEWQSILFFNLMFNRLLRITVKKSIISLIKNYKNNLIRYTKVSIKNMLSILANALFIIIDKFLIKSEKNLLNTFKLLFNFVINTFRFLINSFKLILFIVKSFYSFIISLFNFNTYKGLLKKLYYIIHLVFVEIYFDIKLIYKLFILLPSIIVNLVYKLSLKTKISLISLIIYCRKFYLKAIFVTTLLVIFAFNLNLLINNNNLFLNIVQKYQSNLSVTNTIPTFISFANNLKSNSLVKYKKFTLNVKDFKELNQELLRFNIDSNEAQKICHAINTAHVASNVTLKGADIQAIFVTSKLNEKHIRVAQLEIPLNNTYDLIVEPSNNQQQYNVYKKKKEITKYLVKQKFLIEENYYTSAFNSKLPYNIISILSNIMSWHIDFQRELNTGDSIEILYQCLYNKNKLITCNNIIYVSIKLSHKKLVFYNYDGKYYLSNGRSAATALLRTPIEGYRISSPFGRRSHPILGYSIFHKGVDFAAPTGTPVPSAGNGIVKKVAISNSYGKYIEIQHNAYLSTVYAHLNAFTKDLHVGQKVVQREIIGYVGATGWATGPHLHYEIHFNGNPVNPMDVRIPSTYYLSEENLNRFNNYKKEIHQILLKLPLDQKASITFNNI